MKSVVFTHSRREVEKRALLFFLSVSLTAFALGLLPHTGFRDPLIDTWFSRICLVAVASLATWPLCDARSSSLRIAAQGMIGLPILLAVFGITTGLGRQLDVPCCGGFYISFDPAHPLVGIISPLYFITALAGPTLLVLDTSLQRAEEKAGGMP